MRMTTRLLKIAVVAAVCLITGILAICALQVVGVLIPSIPYLGTIGTLFFPPFSPWCIAFSLLVTATSGWRWSARRSWAALILGIFALLTAVGAAAVFFPIANAVARNGVEIGIGDLFPTGTSDGSDPSMEVVNYGSFEGMPLSLGIFRPGGRATAQPSPVLLYVHGGGWIEGTKADSRGKDMRWFANQGWLVVSIDYTLSTAQRPMWDETTSQVGCSMAWLSANAVRYGGDVSRLSLIGESAGGNLVINAAYKANSGLLKSSCGGQIPKVKAVIADYPVVDVASFYDNPDPILGRPSRLMAGTYTGGSPREFPNRYSEVRSENYLSPAAPPTLVIVGERDHLVPPEPTYDFVRQARSHGIEVRLIQVPNSDHGFDSGGVGNKLYRYASREFLLEHDRL